MSGHCGHAHGGHGHGHDHGHDHDHVAEGTGEEGWDLYKEVDLSRCSVLNVAENDALMGVLRPWDKRLEREPVMMSDADEQMLVYLPFTAAVKLKSISLIGAGGQENPKTLRVFLNIDQMDFSTAESTHPTQEWELVADDPRGEIEYPTKYTKFQNVRSIWLFIKDNFGADVTTLQYIGLKGTATRFKREAVKASYEVSPMAADHPKTGDEQFNPSIM